nr:hypothetical protein [Tanacetum cinerariifolium]
SKPVTSNSVSTPQVSKGVNNAKVIAPRMFRISPDKISREAKKVPNTANLLLPVTPKVILTALMVIMLVPLTKWNLKSNGFQILLLCLAGYPDLFVVRRLRLFQAHDKKSKAFHQFRLEVYGNCPLRE